MFINKNILICLLILFFSQIIIWFQLNAQIRWEWFKHHYLILSLLGVPISYALLISTKYGYEGFGALWPIRLLGFATGMITFPFITWAILGEGISFRTGISLILGIIIMGLQLGR